MPNTTGTAAGTTYGYFGFMSTDGFLYGATTSAPSVGTSSGMLRIKGIKTAAPAVPEPEVVQVTGDDGLISEFEFNSIQQRSFTIETAVQSLDQDALLQATLVQTMGDIRIGVMDTNDTVTFNVCVLLQGQAKSQDSTSTGTAVWTGLIIPLATARPLGRAQWSEREPATYRWQITPQLSSYDPWGITIADGVHGTTGLRQRPLYSPNPIHMQAFTGAGSAAAITLDYTPISAAKTFIYANRALIGTSTVSTANKTATPSGSITSGHNGIVIYEYQV